MIARFDESITARPELDDVTHFEELLADPIAHLVMRHDGIDAETVRRVMREAANRIAANKIGNADGTPGKEAA